MEIAQFETLSNHEIRKLIQKSISQPNDRELNYYLLKGLWNQSRFKDFYDLLPEISEQALQSTLKLHTKALIRRCLNENSSLKKLIPIAISYSSFLGDNERKSLIDLLEKMISLHNSDSLKKFYQCLIEVSNELRKIFINKNLTHDPKLLLTPDIAAKLNLDKPIADILHESGSVLEMFYRPGGYLYILAECGYWSEIDFKKVKSLNQMVCFRLEVLYCLEVAPKELNTRLIPYTDLIISQQSYQENLCDELSKSLMKFKGIGIDSDNEKLPSFLESQAKLFIEVSKYLDWLHEKLPTSSENFNFVYTHYLYLLSFFYRVNKRAGKEEIQTQVKIFNLISTNYDKYTGPGIWANTWLVIEPMYEIILIALVQNLIDICNVAKLIEIVRDDQSELALKKVISDADSFLAEDWDNLYFTTNILKLCELFLQVLENLDLQKNRIKKLKALEKKIRKGLI
jgi:hypothetical protein